MVNANKFFDQLNVDLIAFSDKRHSHNLETTLI
jgi:hypothetical protein